MVQLHIERIQAARIQRQLEVNPRPLVRAGDEMMSPEEAARMNFQIGENAIWYQSQGITISRSTLERIYQENGHLRMDFTPERAEEERLQREISMRGWSLNPTNSEPESSEAINYASLGRQFEILLRIASLFNEIGVHCTVINHQGGSDIELQFRIFSDTPECPTSIGGGLAPDGAIRLRLGYPAR